VSTGPAAEAPVDCIGEFAVLGRAQKPGRIAAFPPIVLIPLPGFGAAFRQAQNCKLSVSIITRAQTRFFVPNASIFKKTRCMAENDKPPPQQPSPYASIKGSTASRLHTIQLVILGIYNTTIRPTQSPSNDVSLNKHPGQAYP
jgi:hypothetical protein